MSEKETAIGINHLTVVPTNYEEDDENEEG